MSYVPVEIANFSPVNTVQPGAGDPGILRYGGSLFTVLTVNTGGTVQVWKSSDQGATWSRLDQAHEPLDSGNTCANFDGSQTLCFALVSLTDIFLEAFDLATEAWGAPFAGGVLAPATIFGLYRRSTGDLVLLVEDGTIPNPGFGAFVFNGAWSAIIDLGLNVAALPGYSGAMVTSYGSIFPAVMDVADTLHIFFGLTDYSTPGWTGREFYQQLLSSGALGSFFDFPGQGTSPVDILLFGTPAIAGDTIVMPVTRSLAGPVPDYQDVYIGTPLAAPVWTALGPPGIDAASFGVFGSGGAVISGAAAFDGAQWLVLFVQATDPVNYGSNQSRLCASALPAGPWTAQTLFDFITDPCPPGFVFLGQGIAFETLRPGSVLSRISASTPSFENSVFFLMPPAGPGPVPLVGCNNPPVGVTLNLFAHNFVASGGTPPYTWAVTAGAMPPGVTLDGATGIASGTPSASGLFGFTLQVTDSGANTATSNCQIIVAVDLKNLEIIVRGVKRVPATSCEPLEEGLEPPHVKRAV